MRGETGALKSFARELGVSLIGIASVDRFVGAPRGHAPNDFMPGARSVVSIALKLPDAIVERHHYLDDAAEYSEAIRYRIQETHIYNKQGYALPNLMLDELGYRIALKLEDMGYRALPLPATFASYTMPDVSTEEAGYFGVFSHRHAAVRTGLGEFGYNNIVITREFGPRVRFSSIVTSAPLEADPMVAEPICLRDACRKCLDVCPSTAIQLRDDRPDGIFVDPPSRTYVRGCVNRPEGHPLGTCLYVCPVGRRTAV